jgi:hypothetical protein
MQTGALEAAILEIILFQTAAFNSFLEFGAKSGSCPLEGLIQSSHLRIVTPAYLLCDAGGCLKSKRSA